MAGYGYLAGGIAIGGIGIVHRVIHFIKEHHPLVISEKIAWAKDHDLAIDEHLRDGQRALLDNFTGGSQIKLCYIMVDEGTAFQYEHWFITNGTWYLEFGNGQGLTGHKVTMHTNPKSNYYTRQTFRVDAEVRERMGKVIGATNYSLLLRNCEHLANYVCTGRWASMQTIRQGRISKRLLDFVTEKQHLALRNLLPKELRTASQSIGRSFDATGQGFVQYSLTQQVLDAADTGSYNVVFLGPTGSGKSNLINLLYNKFVAPTCDEADSDVLSCTRNMQFYTGQGDCWLVGELKKKTQTVNLIDTIGFCDSEMSADEVYRLTKEQIEGNCMRIHRVVVCTSGKIEHHHADAIKQFLKWLKYDPGPKKSGCPAQPVIFVYTKCDSNTQDSPERRANNLVQMADRLGVDVNQMVLRGEGASVERKYFDMNIAVGFPPGSDVLNSDDYKKLGEILFNVPMVPFDIDRSWCAIL